MCETSKQTQIAPSTNKFNYFLFNNSVIYVALKRWGWGGHKKNYLQKILKLLIIISDVLIMSFETSVAEFYKKN